MQKHRPQLKITYGDGNEVFKSTAYIEIHPQFKLNIMENDELQENLIGLTEIVDNDFSVTFNKQQSTGKVFVQVF